MAKKEDEALIRHKLGLEPQQDVKQVLENIRRGDKNDN